jgi:hypothetical protein
MIVLLSLLCSIVPSVRAQQNTYWVYNLYYTEKPSSTGCSVNAIPGSFLDSDPTIVAQYANFLIQFISAVVVNGSTYYDYVRLCAHMCV